MSNALSIPFTNLILHGTHAWIQGSTYKYVLFENFRFMWPLIYFKEPNLLASSPRIHGVSYITSLPVGRRLELLFISTGINPLNAELNLICHLLALLGAHHTVHVGRIRVNPLNPELNPICYLLALLGAHHFLHFSRIRVKLLTFRRLMSYIYIYIYGAPILDVSRSHTTTQHSR